MGMKRVLIGVLVVVLLPLALLGPRATAVVCAAGTKIGLWNTGQAVLRGANVYQGRNVFNADVPFGDGAFSQADFDDLAAAGANYVHISHAGLFAEDAPYALDQAAVDNLDKILGFARNAGLYAGIAFRSGPGRNDLSIVDSTNAQAKHDIWTSQAAQDAWVEQVKFAAQKYAADPIVVGLSVMVEPTAYSQHDFIGPEEFYAQFGGTIEDVNGLYAKATTAIRSVAPTLPILLEPEGHGNINWLPFLKVTGDPATVYTPHDYAPFKFTHDGKGKYPSRKNNETTLAQSLGVVDSFGQTNGVPVAITEFGARKIAKTASKYIAARISIQDTIGNWVVWVWQPAGFRDKFSVHNPGKIQDVLKAAWATNCTRT
jgi:aryl-phospho-beta-D-glucosidase BglC (GH1 family)